MVERIALIGLSGTGKSSVAPLVAARLGWDVVDTDRLVAERFGMSIPRIFARYGEAIFRAAEREALLDACRRQRSVIATGGGVVLDERNWVPLRSGTAVVHLWAPIETLVRRLQREASDAEVGRPLLAGDLEVRLRALWEQRRHLYERADLTISTDDRSPEHVADEIVRAVERRSRDGLVPFLSVLGSNGRSDLFVHSGLLGSCGVLLRQRWPKARRAFIVTDTHVATHWQPSVERSLEQYDFSVQVLQVRPGEASKSLATVERLLDELLASRIERSDVLVALGGGVIGDLTGFVASIVLRGVGLVQIPTTLLAMVDASVGGKTGIDHQLGKNLIGTFYQPHLVIADPTVLGTLPERERRAGWAEVVKHGLIECTATGEAQPRLLELIRQRSFDSWWNAGNLDEVIRHNIRIKASVVAADERESGLRRILNLGHTLGHAVEAASDYRLLHGEAIAIGLRGEARIARRMDLCSEETTAIVDELLDEARLPSRAPVDPEVVIAKLAYDKKVEGGMPTWILPTDPGHVVARRDIPEALVREVVSEFSRADAVR